MNINYKSFLKTHSEVMSRVKEIMALMPNSLYKHNSDFNPNDEFIRISNNTIVIQLTLSHYGGSSDEYFEIPTEYLNMSDDEIKQREFDILKQESIAAELEKERKIKEEQVRELALFEKLKEKLVK
jgi:hypothetical protein